MAFILEYLKRRVSKRIVTLLTSNGQAILVIAASTSIDKLPIYNGILAAMYAVASVAGPLYVLSSIVLRAHNTELELTILDWAAHSQVRFSDHGQ